MSRIKAVMQNLKEQKRKGLIAYVTAGCPNYDATLQAVEELEKAGADIIEIGIPFSDPMADGPVIQKAAVMALKEGATTAKTCELIAKIRTKSNVPLVIMTYINTIINISAESFIKSFAEAGIDGVIVPDMPIEECSLLEGICAKEGVDLIHFAAPTTTPERISAVCQKASGFLYCISNTGVTGVRKVDYSEIGAVIKNVRRHTSIPTAIGFGIGDSVTAVEAARFGDAVIVGSAVMKKLMDLGVGQAAELISAIRGALDRRA